jgi:signal transduction histidine kinase
MIDVGLKNQRLEKVAQGWGILSRNSGVMKDLVLDMLTYARAREPEVEPCDINELCTGVAELMREKGTKKKVEIALRLQPDVGTVVLDPKGIYRCVLNLVGNAIDACDKDPGRVEIATRVNAEEPLLEIAVRDNGCGISEEHLRGLFKVFFSTKGSKGTGLGLAVTQKIIHEHEGRIRVESELDVGTTFVVTLPLRTPGEASTE